MDLDKYCRPRVAANSVATTGPLHPLRYLFRFGDQVNEEMAATIIDEFYLIPEIRGGWFPINLRDIDSRPVSPYVGRA